MYSPLILSVYKHFYFLKTWKLVLQYIRSNNDSNTGKYMRIKEYQSNTPVGRKRQNTGIFKGEIPNRAYPLLLLAAVSDETDKTGITQ